MPAAGHVGSLHVAAVPGRDDARSVALTHHCAPAADSVVNVHAIAIDGTNRSIGTNARRSSALQRNFLPGGVRLPTLPRLAVAGDRLSPPDARLPLPDARPLRPGGCPSSCGPLLSRTATRRRVARSPLCQFGYPSSCGPLSFPGDCPSSCDPPCSARLPVVVPCEGVELCDWRAKHAKRCDCDAPWRCLRMAVTRVGAALGARHPHSACAGPRPLPEPLRQTEAPAPSAKSSHSSKCDSLQPPEHLNSYRSLCSESTPSSPS
jgi:hypothetical protein